MATEPQYSFLAQSAKHAAHMNSRETNGLRNIDLGDRERHCLAPLNWQPTVHPEIELNKKMSDPFPGRSQAQINDVIVCAGLLHGQLATNKG